MEINSNEFNTHYASIQKNFIKHTYEVILNNKIDQLVVETTIEGFVTKEPVLYQNRLEYTLKKYHIGDKWGDVFDCGWFKLTGKIPNYNSHLNYELKLDLSGEAAIFDETGSPIKGFTNGSSAFDFNLGYPGKLYADVNDLIDANGNFVFWIEAGANDLFGNLSEDGKVITSEIVVRNKEILKLYYDMETLYSTLCVLPTDDKTYHKLFETLLEVSYNITYENKNWLEKSLKVIDDFYVTNKKSDFLVTAVGHAHMDLAWLWPIRETRRKIGRFIANMIFLIEKYDDFIFGISQPQQIQWLKEDYPLLYEKFKHYVAIGRIELQGAMWVESDTNVTGEESLVRQMLHGQNFYKKEFGKTVNSLWLPDVFGYNGNMPQIIKKSGLDYFMTIKISWSLINEFPHHSFNWHGIDGSSVLTHMPPEGTYNSPATPRFFVDAKKKYKEFSIAPIALSAYGIGDGGGGPGIEHVERILRQNNIPNIPNVEMNRSDYFFNKLSKYQDKLPTYKGELYLENHQGTYTSQSNIKRYNRMMEQRLKTLETLLVLTNEYSNYRLQLNKLWEETLLYQFHDILPGSSIKRVYTEALDRYKIMLNEVESIINKITSFTSGNKKRFNPLLGNVNKTFKMEERYYRYTLKPFETDFPVAVYSMENSLKDLTILTKSLIITVSDKTGQMVSLISKKNNRELLKGEGNKLSVYKDLGDAWNIEPHYRKQEPVMMDLVDQEIKKYGPIIEIENTYVFKESKLKEIITIDTETDDIIFKHHVDWKNVGYMLRTSFPVKIASDTAAFDIQFGHLERSRLNDTTITKAQFEVSGQQWVSVKDGKNNVSLLTKNKYGFHVKEDLLDINLLRSTNSPCNDGDIDETTYEYQLLVDAQDLTDVDQKAQVLNSHFPLTADNFETESIVELDNKMIAYSALKYGHNDDNVYIRLYNRSEQKVTTNLKIKANNYELYETNLIEENPKKTSNELHFEKFEIKTLKLLIK